MKKTYSVIKTKCSACGKDMEFSFPYARSDNPDEWRKGAPWKDFRFHELEYTQIEAEICSVLCFKTWLDGIKADVEKKWK